MKIWLIITGILSFLIGIAVGARGYYLYADHMFMKHPEFFKMILERKILKQQMRGKTS